MAPSRRSADDASFKPFKDLDKLVDRRALKPASAEKNKPDDEPVDDAGLFEHAMRDVREIREFRELPVPRRPAVRRPVPPDPAAEAQRELHAITSGERPIVLDQTSEYVEWGNPSLPAGHALAKALHAGSHAVQDSLDLHGFTVEETEPLVGEYLRQARTKGLRCVKIIHGRGLKSAQGPVVKQAVIRLLSGPFSKYVAAFATARRRDGGLGALYVLLKSSAGKRRRA